MPDLSSFIAHILICFSSMSCSNTKLLPGMLKHELSKLSFSSFFFFFMQTVAFCYSNRKQIRTIIDSNVYSNIPFCYQSFQGEADIKKEEESFLCFVALRLLPLHCSGPLLNSSKLTLVRDKVVGSLRQCSEPSQCTQAQLTSNECVHLTRSNPTHPHHN